MKTVLFGNGLNYLSKNHISWQDLLTQIKGENLFENGVLPNTFIYERSLIGSPISFDTLTKKEEAIKLKIAKMLTDISGNSFFDKIAEIKADNYLTTNYDYALLESYKSNPGFELINKSTESIYSIRRYKEIILNGKTQTKLWSIHGEIDTPPSIMLGLDHYCGSIGKIDSYIKGHYEYEVKKEKIKTSSIIEKLNNKTLFDQSSWIELFFNSDVHIVGLGLDFSEIDLWWILNKRARLKLDHDTKNLITNNITYYSISGEKSHLETLETLHINVVRLSGDYEVAYNNIINKINGK